jgi:uncharacterized protein (DUF2267 family)
VHVQVPTAITEPSKSNGSGEPDREPSAPAPSVRARAMRGFFGARDPRSHHHVPGAGPARRLLLLGSMMATQDLISHVAAHAGVSADIAERALRAVLSGIGAYLGAPHRQLVADELSPALAAALLAQSGRARPIDKRLLGPGITAGDARELIASVCRVLAEELSGEALHAIRVSAPPEVAAFLAPPAPAAPPRPTPGAHRETLAAGHPGSRHPVSEARPPRAQPDSVAAENPRASSKLSSAAPSPPERFHETLAEGQPGAAHSLAGSRH